MWSTKSDCFWFCLLHVSEYCFTSKPVISGEAPSRWTNCRVTGMSFTSITVSSQGHLIGLALAHCVPHPCRSLFLGLLTWNFKAKQVAKRRSLFHSSCRLHCSTIDNGILVSIGHWPLSENVNSNSVGVWDRLGSVLVVYFASSPPSFWDNAEYLWNSVPIVHTPCILLAHWGHQCDFSNFVVLFRLVRVPSFFHAASERWFVWPNSVCSELFSSWVATFFNALITSENVIAGDWSVASFCPLLISVMNWCASRSLLSSVVLWSCRPSVSNN